MEGGAFFMTHLFFLDMSMNWTGLVIGLHLIGVVKYPIRRGDMRLLASLLILLLSLTGCEAGSDVPVIKSKNESTEITLKPVDLFKGDGEKFKLFLGDMSGAFKLRYEGYRPHASLDIDIWKDGKKVESVGSIGDLFFDSAVEEKDDEIEVIVSIDTISIKDQADDLNKIKISIRNDSGASLYTLTTPWDKALGTRGVIQKEPSTFTTEESVHVWGMQATSTYTIRVLDFSPESLGSIEQAIIFTLRFED